MIKKEKTVRDVLDEVVQEESLEITANGIAINSKNPPSEEDAKNILQHAADICNIGERDSSSSMWVLGNLAYILRDYDVDMSEVVDATDHSLSTITRAMRTYEFFKLKRYNLPFTHHKEVAALRGLTDKHKHVLMGLAEEGMWSVALMRKVARQMKIMRDRHQLDMFLKLKGPQGLLPLTLQEKPQSSKPKAFIRIYEGKYTVSEEKPKGPGFIAELKSIVQSEAQHDDSGADGSGSTVAQAAGEGEADPR